jgi:hypothetical protein
MILKVNSEQSRFSSLAWVVQAREADGQQSRWAFNLVKAAAGYVTATDGHVLREAEVEDVPNGFWWPGRITDEEIWLVRVDEFVEYPKTEKVYSDHAGAILIPLACGSQPETVLAAVIRGLPVKYGIQPRFIMDLGPVREAWWYSDRETILLVRDDTSWAIMSPLRV